MSRWYICRHLQDYSCYLCDEQTVLPPGAIYLNTHSESMRKQTGHHVKGSVTLCISTVEFSVLQPGSSLIHQINETQQHQVTKLSLWGQCYIISEGQRVFLMLLLDGNVHHSNIIPHRSDVSHSQALLRGHSLTFMILLSSYPGIDELYDI